MAFWSKKPKVSSPISVKKVTGYQAVPGAVSSLPQYNSWLAYSAGGGGSPPRDGCLCLIDGYLKAYHEHDDPWDQASVLGQLYFLTDHWLKWAAKNVNVLTRPRKSAVEGLFMSVVDMMCKLFQVSVNYLPQVLEDYWGRVLTPHGHMVDTQIVPTGASPLVAEYLDRAQAEKYRLVFDHGLVYQATWWLPPPYKMILAESNRVGWTDARGLMAPQMMENGYAGFALSMGRQFYMAHHRGCFNQDNFFHSSYLAGDSVLCTGTMLIQKGVVKAIKNDSGHYQPTLEHLLNVVQALQMYGTNPADIQVKAVPYSWRDDGGTVQDTSLEVTGQELLDHRWTGNGLKFRYDANQGNIASRKLKKVHH